MTDDDGWAPEHGYTISSPYAPDGSEELKSIHSPVNPNFSTRI